VLGELTGMKRKLREIHRTFDAILVDIIDKRRRERAQMVAARKEVVDENVVDVMLTLQKNDDAWGFPVTDNTIKAVVLVSLLLRLLLPFFFFIIFLSSLLFFLHATPYVRSDVLSI
jgi:hypothetical protein